jgi:hypothetical protein
MGCLIVFVKNKIKGSVKTRIANSTNDDVALFIYEQLIEITKHVVFGLKNTKVIYFSDYIENDDIWPKDQFNKKVQAKGDIGNRMKAAINNELKHQEKVVLIGSDCPYLTERLLIQAFEALNDHDVVFGPCTDGGYYLIGMKTMHDALFEDIPWSTSKVLALTIEKAKKHLISFFLLEELQDIDVYENWLEYLSKQCIPK